MYVCILIEINYIKEKYLKKENKLWEIEPRKEVIYLEMIEK